MSTYLAVAPSTESVTVMSIGKLVSTLMEEPLATVSLLTLITSLKPASTVTVSSWRKASPGTRTTISEAMASGVTSSARRELSAALKDTPKSSAFWSLEMTLMIYSVVIAETSSATITFVPSARITAVSPLVTGVPPIVTTS